MGVIAGVNAVNDGLIFTIDAGNQFCYPKFSNGTVCGTAGESTNLTLTAPTGAIFDQINYASYGTPNGTCGLYSNGSCHSAISQTTCELYFLNKSEIEKNINLLFNLLSTMQSFSHPAIPS
jgi:hypothetical protein